MKRNKDRHQLAHSSSFRYQQRPSSSPPPPPYLVEDGESSSEHGIGHMTPFACPLEVNTSPLPVSPGFLKYPRDRSNSSCSNYRGSPYDLTIYSPDSNNSNPLRRNSDPTERNTDNGVLSPPLPMNMEEEYDQPLDMSKKSRILSSSSSSSSPPFESHHHPSDHRQQLHHNNHHHPHHSLHHHGSTSSSSSSSTSSRSNTCSPESIYYKGNHINSNNSNSKNPIGLRQNSTFFNQPQHLYQQSPPPPIATINSPSNNMINHNNHTNSHSGNPHLQPRPSVITCASTLFGPRRSTSSTSSNQHQTICSNESESVLYPLHHHHNQHIPHHQHHINSGLTNSEKTLNTSSPRPSSLASTSSSSSLSSFSSSSSCSSSFHNNRHHQSSTIKSQTLLRPENVNDLSLLNKHGKKKLDEPKKLVIHGEDSDSGIDEHFRRSLGDQYRNYTNVSMSVDDHFAKALGDTWFKLKRETQNGPKGNSYNKPNATTIPS